LYSNDKAYQNLMKAT